MATTRSAKDNTRKTHVGQPAVAALAKGKPKAKLPSKGTPRNLKPSVLKVSARHQAAAKGEVKSASAPKPGKTSVKAASRSKVKVSTITASYPHPTSSPEFTRLLVQCFVDGRNAAIDELAAEMSSGS